MKKIILYSLILLPQLLIAQTKSTQNFHKKYSDAFTMFFYKSTLKMIAPEDNAEFLDMIKGIEKAKLLRISKKNDYSHQDLAEYKSSIKKESFEEIMSIRDKDHDIKVFLKEKNSVTKGLILLMDTKESVSILDIVGKIELDKITMLTKQIDF